MTISTRTLRTCSKGHNYYKSSDCPSCPTCEQENKPESRFLSMLSAPARRALEHEGITTLQQLSTFSEKEILKLHGIGPASLPTLKSSLEEGGLAFKEVQINQ
jgi:DNA-directed RNA polymerase alpha subunit